MSLVLNILANEAISVLNYLHNRKMLMEDVAVGGNLIHAMEKFNKASNLIKETDFSMEGQVSDTINQIVEIYTGKKDLINKSDGIGAGFTINKILNNL